MKKFLILHFGFVPPSPEDMARWNQWFDAIADRQIERGHLPGGREVIAQGTKDLSFGPDSMTGYTMIQAADLDEAARIAGDCPIVVSTRGYEIGG